MHSRPRKPRLIALLVAALAGAPSFAATITVAPGEVAVDAGNGRCSLREAILNAESDSDESGGDCVAGAGADTIELAAGSTYTLTNAQLYLSASTGLPGIRSTLTVNGNGATIERDRTLFIAEACDNGPGFRLLQIGDIGNLTLRNATLRYGCAAQAGGAIHNHGTLVLEDVRVVENAAFASAGAIQNDNALTLVRSTVGNNRVVNGAGGGIVSTGTLTVEASTIQANSTPGSGGGLLTSSGSRGTSTAMLVNSTLSGNQSDGLGGGAHLAASTTLLYATVAANHGAANAAAATPGSGLYRSGGSVTLTGSLLALQVNGSNCRGTVTASGSAADDSSCAGATEFSAPLLAPLADNGGPTLTHALMYGSPLIDAGSNATASGLTVDQRGLARIVNGTVDFGAVEFSGSTDQDGLPDSTELAVPNAGGVGTGDGNGDSIPDSEQSHVASLPIAGGGGSYATVVSNGSRPLSAVSSVPRPAGVPGEFVSPFGAFAFTATGLGVGATETFELYLPYNRAIVGALKRNRLTGVWENVAVSVTHIGTVKTKITYALTDGGPYDADAAANGQIQDPVVPYLQATSIPTLSQWGLLILSALMAFSAAVVVRRRGSFARR